MTLTAEQAIQYLQSKLGGIKGYKDTNQEYSAPHPELMWTSGDLILRGQFLVGIQEYQFRICKSQPKLSPKKRVPQTDYVGKGVRVEADKISEFVGQYKRSTGLVQAFLKSQMNNQ